MKNKKALVITAIALAVLTVAGVSVYAASNYGTQSDPLVTLSYLTDRLTPTLLDQFDTELEKAVAELEGQLKSGAGITTTYRLVTLQSGQSLTGSAGCEVLLREGAAAVTSGGLIDMTDAISLAGGSPLAQNHLCMFSESGSLAASSQVTLLVRGDYKVA